MQVEAIVRLCFDKCDFVDGGFLLAYQAAVALPTAGDVCAC